MVVEVEVPDPPLHLVSVLLLVQQQQRLLVPSNVLLLPKLPPKVVVWCQVSEAPLWQEWLSVLVQRLPTRQSEESWVQAVVVTTSNNNSQCNSTSRIRCNSSNLLNTLSNSRCRILVWASILTSWTAWRPIKMTLLCARAIWMDSCSAKKITWSSMELEHHELIVTSFDASS